MDSKSNEKSYDIMFFVFLMIIFITAMSAFFYNVVIPDTVESRAKELSLMIYDGENNEFIFKDSVVIRSADLYYLQHGTIKGFNQK